MKDTYRGIFLCFAIVLASAFSGDQVAAFGEGSWSDSILCSLGVRSVQVAPYVRVGYQRMTVNLNVPIGGYGDPVQFTWNDMDCHALPPDPMDADRSNTRGSHNPRVLEDDTTTTGM